MVSTVKPFFSAAPRRLMVLKKARKEMRPTRVKA